ncbi:MAG TPA: ribose 5-phosphate isomerase B [Abditibacteriaceae bacterium]|jgi:ribose 5-phosphate isomerase B
MKIAVGADHAGFELKADVVSWIEEMGHEVLDCGTYSPDSVDYSDFAAAVGAAVVEQRVDLGVLVCGTGQGVAMAANKIRGVRAALCNETYSARLTREHNNANILTMGARIVGTGVAREILDAFLQTPFSQETRHQRRIDKMMLLEQSLPV